METTESTSLRKRLSQESTKTETMITAAVYSTSKFVEFNDVVTHKLTAIGKHIYEVLDQDVDVDKLPKEKQLEAYKVKSEIFRDVLQACARTVNDAAVGGSNTGNAVQDYLIDLLVKRKLHDLSKKFRFDFYYAYRYILASFFAASKCAII